MTDVETKQPNKTKHKKMVRTIPVDARTRVFFLSPEMRDAAMNLGVNLIYYSFNQWNDAISKQK